MAESPAAAGATSQTKQNCRRHRMLITQQQQQQHWKKLSRRIESKRYGCGSCGTDIFCSSSFSLETAAVIRKKDILDKWPSPKTNVYIHPTCIICTAKLFSYWLPLCRFFTYRSKARSPAFRLHRINLVLVFVCLSAVKFFIFFLSAVARVIRMNNLWRYPKSMCFKRIKPAVTLRSGTFWLQAPDDWEHAPYLNLFTLSHFKRYSSRGVWKKECAGPARYKPLNQHRPTPRPVSLL